MNAWTELWCMVGSLSCCGGLVWLAVSVFAITAVMLAKKSDRGAGREL